MLRLWQRFKTADLSQMFKLKFINLRFFFVAWKMHVFAYFGIFLKVFEILNIFESSHWTIFWLWEDSFENQFELSNFLTTLLDKGDLSLNTQDFIFATKICCYKIFLTEHFGNKIADFVRKAERKKFWWEKGRNLTIWPNLVTRVSRKTRVFSLWQNFLE